ncbi:MAG: hypothetical protein HY905_00605 [Deltaproteobacteria bacterium]|nr:hypothetical protein [Deltaproteobacteria bacterium]
MSSNAGLQVIVPAVLGIAAWAAPAGVAAQTPPAAEATPAPAATPPPAAPDRLSVGSAGGYFRPGILLQGWYVADFMGANSDEIDNTFRIRRAELSVRGEILPDWIAYKVMIDPARSVAFGSATIDVQNQDPPPTDPENPEQVTVRSPSSAVADMFQDYYITFLLPYVDVSIGQFKLPVSYEGYNSSGHLLFPERFLIARLWGDRRDLGIRLAHKFDWFGYSAGVFNGAGQNTFETNNSKDLALRLEAYPLEGLTIAGVAYATVGDRDQAGTKDRYEGDLRFERWGFLFQGEYIAARDVGSDGSAVWAHGFYAALGYTIADMLQPIVRFGWYDPDLDQDIEPTDANHQTDEYWQLDGGLNWFIVDYEAMLQLSYSRFQYDDRTANNQLILAAQVSY